MRRESLSGASGNTSLDPDFPDFAFAVPPVPSGNSAGTRPPELHRREYGERQKGWFSSPNRAPTPIRFFLLRRKRSFSAKLYAFASRGPLLMEPLPILRCATSGTAKEQHPPRALQRMPG